MPSSICAQSVPCGRKINSAAGSTKCWISHGHATRSTLIFSRVIHFMDSLRGDRVRRRHHYCSAKHCRGRELLALRLRSSACFAARMESVSCSIELELLLIVRCGDDFAFLTIDYCHVAGIGNIYKNSFPVLLQLERFRMS